MYTEAANRYNHLNWEYLEISDDAMKSTYDWITISFPKNADRKFPWAHEYDMTRLFLLCTTFTSSKEAKKWILDNVKKDLSPVHLSLIDSFCYSQVEIPESIDQLILNTDDDDLLYFILKVLERSLLWYNPESSWPGDFGRVMKVASKKLKNKTSMPLNYVDKPDVEGVDYASIESYTHVFYKFQNLVNGIEKGEIYYNIKDLSKQVHDALLLAMLSFFEPKFSSLNEERWERMMDEIAAKETDWCKAQISRNEPMLKYLLST